MIIQDADRVKISSLSEILEVDSAEVVHMAVSLLMLKTQLPLKNKELVILDKKQGIVSGIKYGNDS